MFDFKGLCGRFTAANPHLPHRSLVWTITLAITIPYPTSIGASAPFQVGLPVGACA